ncbi:MAG: CRISPR-associated endonuclease Cas2 [Actinobacteria bacterium]|nr:CRISPR-associated endonuclease Cas2 [Actinomycetota bacterium]
MDVLVTYDIRTADVAGERRLARVAAVCERYGSRVQYSVFECRVSEVMLVRLLGQLQDAIDPAEDSVHIYQMPGTTAASRTILGRPAARCLGQPWII